ncbi:hypothetical protein CAOG_05370 [Capsaspora owczarzaki ATCC 30864]|uniref:Cyclin N-terminal domain-containing protein n=1 Tax=Capsaspora owczarzaki (strain ATCC 30864) TaxID=595528 RepID=A0A0D2WT67_CAPO3|nr:hypothetical protein CAOG_05370 [Capsaspora owczarzaki ATCC 30864]KJE94788.1 hypothetical protein CAOG_005370 [Capsaspora owczarzaki ATCC 30864]|eukprot:XP_004347055.1 hypothetical protein CAOG_05370 [Capsaspora owczarzaki ATCC 30864]
MSVLTQSREQQLVDFAATMVEQQQQQQHLQRPSAAAGAASLLDSAQQRRERRFSGACAPPSSSLATSQAQQRAILMRLGVFLSEFRFELRRRPSSMLLGKVNEPQVIEEPLTVPRDLVGPVSDIVASFIDAGNATALMHKRAAEESEQHQDEQPSEQAQLLESPPSSPPLVASDSEDEAIPELSVFIRGVLRRSNVSFASVLVAIIYMFRIQGDAAVGRTSTTAAARRAANMTKSGLARGGPQPFARSAFFQHPHELFMAALITAEKYLYDVGTVGLDYDLRYWSHATKFYTVGELGDFEMAILAELDYSCTVADSEFESSLNFLKRFVESPQTASAFMLTPPTTPPNVSPCRSPNVSD